MKTSAGAGVSRKNPRTTPEAKSLVCGDAEQGHDHVERGPLGGVHEPGWYDSRSLRGTGRSRANASPSVLIRLPTLRSVRGAWKLFAW